MGHSENARLMTVQDAADEMAVSRWTVYRLIWDGHVLSVQIGRSRRVVRASLEAYLAGLIEEAA
jgi:excisionase family DNA binding protein